MTKLLSRLSPLLHTLSLRPEDQSLRVLALGLASFLAALDTPVVVTALPSVTVAVGVPEAYKWIGAAYMLGSSASVTLWGKLSDVFGRKLMLILSQCHLRGWESDGGPRWDHCRAYR